MFLGLQVTEHNILQKKKKNKQYLINSKFYNALFFITL